MIFTLPLPETTNNTYKSAQGHWYKSAKAKAWEEEAGYAILKQRTAKSTCTENVYVGLAFFVKRDRDIDGGIKPVLDLLQRLRIIDNDRQVKHLNVKIFEDKTNPRVEVEVIPL